MTAAIDARKSTEQIGVATESKSVTRQVENARAFAAAQGWTVLDAHVYVDDGISGAEFDRRPGLNQLLAALPRPPFQRLIVSEQKSLGRESAETGFVIKRLARAGVELFEYTHGRSLTPKNWQEKALSQLQSSADEAHREQTRDRVHEAHTSKHRKGYVVGGRVFGYRNRDVHKGTDNDGRPLKSHVERVVNEVEAAVVRRIFTLYDSGLGLKRIAKLLTDEGAPEPHHARRTDGLSSVKGWSPSTVRGILLRETYRGIVVWNKTRKRDNYGQWAPTDRPKSEWITTAVPSLRIIDEGLWKRVESRRRDTEGRTLRFESGRISGRPPKHAPVNLLAGLATCGACGGGLIVERSNNKKGRYAYYICHRHRATGTCTNALRLPVDDMNETVLQSVEEHALTPEAVEQVLLAAERDDEQDARKALDRERKDISRRLERLTEAIATGGDIPALVVGLRDLEARRRDIEAQLRDLRPVPRLAPEVIEGRLAEWRRLLRASTTTGRTVLQRVLQGRITFTPRADGLGYDFAAPTRFDKLFSGIACTPPAFVEAGTDGTLGLGPAETFDGDYGRILEAAIARKGWRARQDSNLRPSAPEADALSS
jgi:site-specific DNA recombinase